MGSLPGAPASDRALFFCGLTALSLLLPASLLVSGCKPKPVASVNGETLTDADFAKLCETTAANTINTQGPAVGMQVLENWIKSTVLAQEAKKQGVYPTDAELNARIDGMRKSAQFSNTTLEDTLRQRGVTMETFKQEILRDMIGENLMAKGVTVSDEDVRKQFDRQKASFTQPEQVEISQVTVDSEDALKKVKNELGPTAQFPVVANTYSKDPFAQTGGRVPFPLTRQGIPGGPVCKEAIAAAFKLKEGEVSEPVKCGANWVIVKLERKIAAKEPKFEDIRELMRSFMRRQKAQTSPGAQQMQQNLMSSFRQAKVEVYRPEYRAITDQLRVPAGPSGGAGGPPVGAPGAGAAAPPSGPVGGPVGAEGAGGAPPPPPPPGR